MRRLSNTTRVARFATVLITSAVVCLLAVADSTVDVAGESPADEALSPSSPAGQADEATLEQQIEEQLAKLQRLQAELEAIESAPLPERPVPARKAPAEKRIEVPKEIPSKPIKGAEEELADALFALGKYEEAYVLYEHVAESKPNADSVAWAHLQLGNCARRTRDYVVALKAYEKLMNESPDNPWTEEAAWWCSQIKWLLLWNETMRQNAGETGPGSQAGG